VATPVATAQRAHDRGRVGPVTRLFPCDLAACGVLDPDLLSACGWRGDQEIRWYDDCSTKCGGGARSRFEMGYFGPERRIHRIFITRNTEYHMRQRTCVRIRDRQSGRWVENHRALNLIMTGSYPFGSSDSDINLSDVPEIGECVFLNANGIDLITSPVLAIERPSRDVVRTQYPAQS
jgi:hypothetical protein